MNDESKTDQEIEELEVVKEDTGLELDTPEDELQQVLRFLRIHGSRVITGVCVGLIIVAGMNAFRTHKQNKLRESSQRLLAAQSSQELETLMSQYPDTPSAPLALLKLAKTHYNSENYDIALNKYAEFKETYPDHSMFLSAELGSIHCMEAKGLYDKALEGFTAFMTAHPDHFLVPQALLGTARCFKNLGRKAEAKEVYEEYIAKNPKSEWTPLIEDMLEDLVAGNDGKQKPEAQKNADKAEK